MKLIWNLEDYYKALNECLKDSPTNIWISTFGIYAGITKDNKDVRKDYGKVNLTGEFLSKINRAKIECNLICGLPILTYCDNKKCKDCETKWEEAITRYSYTKERFPNINWKFAAELHFKCVVFQYADKPTIAFTGGRNLTDSGWDDMSIQLDKEDGDKLLSTVVDVWKSKEVLPL